MAPQAPPIEHLGTTERVSHDALVRVDVRVKEILTRHTVDDSARDQTAHQAAAKIHEDAAERMYARGENAGAVEQRELAQADRESAGITAERAQLSRERQRDIASEELRDGE